MLIVSLVHTHQKNGFIERKHHHVVETRLVFLVASSLPLAFWAEAFTSTVYIINILRTPVLNNLCPYEKLFSIKPNYNFLKKIGCVCYPLLRPYNQHKFDFHTFLCSILGYDDKRKCYICLQPPGKIVISHNVLFNEYLFPFSMPNNPFIPNDTSTDTSVSSTTPLTVFSFSHESTRAATTISSSFTMSPLPLASSPTSIVSPPPVPDNNTHPLLTRAKVGIYKPKVFTTSLSNDFLKPSTYKQVVANPLWFHVMQTKYDALLQNNTWTLTLFPSNANLVGCKWVFKRKFNVDGSLQCYKVRLVAKGFHQREGHDFVDTFNILIKKKTTIRVVLTIALSS